VGWLPQQGFVKEAESKNSVSVHLVHPEAETGYTISFIKNCEGVLDVHNIKAGSKKLAFMTVPPCAGAIPLTGGGNCLARRAWMRLPWRP